jgi:hypothetical protein
MSCSNQPPAGWQFGFTLTSEHVWSAFLIYSLLEDAMDRQEYLVLKHFGEHKDQFDDAVQARNQRMRLHRQPELTHFCDKCTRWFRNATGQSKCGRYGSVCQPKLPSQLIASHLQLLPMAYALDTCVVASTTVRSHCIVYGIAFVRHIPTLSTYVPLLDVNIPSSRVNLHALILNTRRWSAHTKIKDSPVFSSENDSGELMLLIPQLAHICVRSLRRLILTMSLSPSCSMAMHWVTSRLRSIVSKKVFPRLPPGKYEPSSLARGPTMSSLWSRHVG